MEMGTTGFEPEASGLRSTWAAIGRGRWDDATGECWARSHDLGRMVDISKSSKDIILTKGDDI
jgi:hypothetical protein